MPDIHSPLALQLAGLYRPPAPPRSAARCVREGFGAPAARAQPVQPNDVMQHPADMPWARSAGSRRIFNPTTFLRSVELLSTCRRRARASSIARRRAPDGSLLREYELVAVDREIEIAPGIFFPAWTYNGQVPGPTLRATEGDRVRVTFVNQGSHPHTIHFHGWHPPEMDGSLPEHQVQPGGRSSTSSTPSRSACTSITATRRR